MSNQSMQASRLRVEQFLAESPLLPPHVGYVVHEVLPMLNLPTFNPHVHPSFCEIYYHKSGSCSYLIEQTKYELHEGDILYIPPNTEHTPCGLEGISPCRVWVGIADSLLAQAIELVKDLNFIGFPDLAKPFFLKASQFTQTELAGSFQRLGRECENEQPGWEMKARCATLDLLTDMARAYYEQYISQEEKNQYLVERIQQYIERHLGEPLDRTTICRLFFISPSTLSHSFQTHLHMSFSQYVTAKRMEFAAQLLQKNNLPAQETGFLCGYEEYTSFFRAFKKFYGYSPKEWLERNSH